MNRRRFLQATAASALLLGAPNFLRAKGPNEKLDIALIGVGLHKGLSWLTASGSTYAEGALGASWHDPLAWLVWIISIAASLGIVIGGVFLMPAVTAFCSDFKGAADSLNVIVSGLMEAIPFSLYSVRPGGLTENVT